MVEAKDNGQPIWVSAKKIHISRSCSALTNTMAHFWTFPESLLLTSCLRTDCSHRRYRLVFSFTLFWWSLAVGALNSFLICAARLRKFAAAFWYVVLRILCSPWVLSVCSRSGCVEIFSWRKTCAVRREARFSYVTRSRASRGALCSCVLALVWSVVGLAVFMMAQENLFSRRCWHGGWREAC